MSAAARRRLGDEVDASAVARQLRNGRTVQSVATGLGIRPGTLRRYLSRAGWGSDGRPLRADTDDRQDEPESDDIAALPGAWVERALCAETDPELFFPEKGGSAREAKAVCDRCTVRAACAEWAVETNQRYGVWGGLTLTERRQVRSRWAS